METIDRQGKYLAYVIAYPDGYDPTKKYPAVFMLHGAQQQGRHMMREGAKINTTDYIYICPTGPREIKGLNGRMLNAWSMPQSTGTDMPPGAPANSAFQFTGPTPTVPIPEDNGLGEFFDEVFAVEKSLTRGNAVLLGFSQGGRVVYWNGLPRPEMFCGLAGVCAAMQDPALMTARLSASGKKQDIFAAYGDYDIIITSVQVRQVDSFLSEHGYNVFFRGYPQGHDFSDPIITDLRPWLARVLRRD